MYFPEYNAILVPAESISPDYLPSTKRKKPIRGLVKLIKEKMDSDVTSKEADTTSMTESKEIAHTPESASITNNKKSDFLMEEEIERENLPLPSHRPLKKPEDFLAEDKEHQQTNLPVQSLLKEKDERPQPNTFGQFFQRPNRPFLPLNRPQEQDGALPVQLNGPDRPGLISFLPAGVTNYFQNPPIKFPLPTFFQNRFPFVAPVTVAKSPYIHYYTKTPTSEAFYYNSFHPRMTTAAYSEAVQSEISDYVNQVQESLLQEHELPTPSDSNSAMMVASVPMGKNQATSLLLRPVAKAVAGPKGVAVASPVAKAVLRKGEKVDIDFDPDAVAIAGPGGQAHAHPKLIVSYTNDKSDEVSSEKSDSSN